MTKQQNNREKKNRAIIEAALELFTRNSWDSVQMQDIADDAGIGIATLFRYFPKKHLIIVAVAVEILTGELDFFHNLHRRTLPGIEKIGMVFDHMNKFGDEVSLNQAKFIDIFDANIGEISDYEVTAAEYFEIRNEISDIVSVLVTEGQADGSLPGGKSVTHEIMTMINNYGLFARKLALMKSVLELETNPDGDAQLKILRGIYMERLR
ncbi:TetR/AcrR family transcriptional regulator [Salinicoccus halitifaciens]|uniref:AcrR family transcriptional regulator n=1 Tax=Salinicoccus halitifaciens TaxID=1073415 RepID=A0ABV2E950_9STAP|nr:TetR/AcrR family transcriptional regulator [Salinicoccus halitifaciens]MCD2138055.1 TetR family transcriptional regulator [Salinicoccus halitifaciens]